MIFEDTFFKIFVSLRIDTAERDSPSKSKKIVNEELYIDCSNKLPKYLWRNGEQNHWQNNNFQLWGNGDQNYWQNNHFPLSKRREFPHDRKPKIQSTPEGVICRTIYNRSDHRQFLPPKMCNTQINTINQLVSNNSKDQQITGSNSTQLKIKKKISTRKNSKTVNF